MKRLMYVAACLAALAACSKEQEPVQANEQLNSSGTVIATAKDFVMGGMTKTVITQSGSDAPAFAWKEGDIIGIIPMNGKTVQSNYEIAEIGSNPKNATFDGGVWALKEGKEYAAYYPFKKEALVSNESLEFSFLDQTQTANNSLEHLGAYDYMYASAVAPQSGSAQFDFEHKISLVRLQLTVPSADTFNSVSLESEESWFASSASLKLSDGTATAVESRKSCRIDLNDIQVASGNVLTVWFSVLPTASLKNKTLSVKIFGANANMAGDIAIADEWKAGKAYSYATTLSSSGQDATLHLTYLTTEPKENVTLFDSTICIAGEENELIKICYGDGSEGTSSSHCFEYAGQHQVDLLFKYDIQEIKDGAFKNNSKLLDIIWPETLMKIGKRSFSGTGLKVINIPNREIQILSEAFSGCKSIKVLSIPPKPALSIGSFAGITADSVYVNNSFDNLPDNYSFNTFPFCQDSKLRIMSVGKDMVEIKKYLFSRISVPIIEFENGSSLKKIEEGAFFGNPEIESINLPKTIEYISEDFVFDNCPKLEKISCNSISYCSVDGILYFFRSGGNYCLFKFPQAHKGNISETQFRHDGIFGIAKGAFRGNTILKSIDIDCMDGVSDYAFFDCTSLEECTALNVPPYASSFDSFIGIFAFSGTALKEFTIPSNVKTIRKYAFMNCANLKKVICESEIPPVLEENDGDSEDWGVFVGNDINRIIYVPDSSVDAYKNANGWERYKNFIYPISSEFCKHLYN